MSLLSLRISFVALLTAALLAAPAAAPAKSKLKPIKILVTNDDGVKAKGIDQLVAALRKQRRVRVVIAAPARNQSGTGGRFSFGPLKGSKTTTQSGFGARSVRGFPADTIRYAYENLFTRPGSRPDVVISGSNAGTNMGKVVDNSGTVGAARAGAAMGIPAIAVSQGLPKGSSDYTESVRQTIVWLRANRSKFKRLEGIVFNLNSPGCIAGTKSRGLVKRAPAGLDRSGSRTNSVNCAQTAPVTGTDLDALRQGFSTLARINAQPAKSPVGTPALP